MPSLVMIDRNRYSYQCDVTIIYTCYFTFSKSSFWRLSIDIDKNFPQNVALVNK